MAALVCDRCKEESSSNVGGLSGALAEGWSRFELLREDGETVYFVTVCPDCLTEGEERGVWPVPSPWAREEAS
jgi:hypothetical protein